MQGPRDRVGALPFPGAFTLYHASDPDFLGRHCYERSAIQEADEADGIVYTRRAGFIDLAHVRITIDTIRFCTEQIRAAQAQGRSSVTLTTLEGSAFLVQWRDLPETAGLSEDQRRKIADELALRLGQRVTYLMMTWHEVLTWFGYRTVSWIDESPSAFTWDDTMSHVLGLEIAGRVLRDRGGGGGSLEPEERAFDNAVTAALRQELIEVGIVAPTETDRAARAVEGWWWSRARPLKRQLDIGLADDIVRPWLVPGFSGDPATPPEAFELPTLSDIGGHDFSTAYSIRIDPLVPQAQRLRDALPSHPMQLDGERDMQLLVEVTRQQMRERLSADVDQPPLPRVAATRPAQAQPRVSVAPGTHRNIR